MVTAAGTEERPPRAKRRRADVIAIFSFVMTVAPVLLTGKIRTPLQGALLAVAALTVALLVYRIILLWRGIDILLLLFLVAFVASSVAFASVTFDRPRITFDKPQDDAARDRDVVLSVVADKLRGTCGEDKDFFSKEVAAALKCSSGGTGVSDVHLGLFKDGSSLYRAYSDSVRQAKVEVDSGQDNCGKNKAGEGAWDYEHLTQPGGRVVCYLDKDNDAWVEWIYDEHKVYAYTYREGNDLAALYNWWLGF